MLSYIEQTYIWRYQGSSSPQANGCKQYEENLISKDPKADTSISYKRIIRAAENTKLLISTKSMWTTILTSMEQSLVITSMPAIKQD